MTRALAAIERIRSAPWYNGQIAAVHVVPGRPAEFAPFPESLDQGLRGFLLSRGITSLYVHQAETFRHIEAGHDVVLATATASGKTLAFALPVLDRLSRDPDATALFLYPMKALSNDQLAFFAQADEALALDLLPAVYDGDTPRIRRPRIRQLSRIVISNPYEIHETLPYHGMWRRFFSNLAFVVIDEAHRYSGVFGSNVAQVTRRLLRVLEAYGSRPRFILASASIANPAEHAARLTSRECVLVDRDTAPSGSRHVVFFDTSASGSPHVQTRNVFATLLHHGLKTLCFTLSRRTAELVASLAVEEGLPVAPYRAGYLPEDRRRLEKGFREGTYRGLVSTDALSLGIDIGDLDAVVVSGYPGSVSAFWQEVGRGGRRGGESLAFFVAFDGIIDQYILRHPDLLMSRSFERATVDLDNEHILAGHMLCAASELPLNPPQDEAIAKRLEGAGLLHRTDYGYIYKGTGRPHEAVRLDSITGDAVTLVDALDEKVLETMDLWRAVREVFPGAVYLHQAQTYLVEDLDLKARVARLRRQDVPYYTVALTSKEAECLDVQESFSLWEAKASLGRLRMTHQVRGYLLKRFDRVIGSRDLDLPAHCFETSGLWIDCPPDLLPKGNDQSGFPAGLGALHALEHTLVGLAPVLISCDPTDLAGFSTIMAPHTGGPAIFIYDGHEGGIGLAQAAFSELRTLLRMARDQLASCPCEKGCPACCLSPYCGNDNQPMDKGAATALASALLGGHEG